MATRIWLGGASGAAGDWSNTANWSGGAVPVNSDIVYIDGPSSNNQSINAGLNQSAVTLDQLHIMANFTGDIGTASAYLQIGATSVFIHERTGNSAGENGSPRIKLNFGTAQATVRAYGSAPNSQVTGLDPVILIGSNAHNTILASGNAKIGLATEDGNDTATWKEINTSVGANNSAPNLNVGPGVTATTVEVGGGVVTNAGANITTGVVSGNGKYIHRGAATATSIDVRDTGTLEYDSDGTLTTLIGAAGATLDFSKDPRAKTVTNCTVNKGTTLNVNNGNPLPVTFTNGIDCNQCGLQDVNLITGSHVTVNVSAV